MDSFDIEVIKKEIIDISYNGYEMNLQLYSNQ